MATILIIDDNDELRETLTVVLEDEGHAVVAAADGRTGVSVFERTRPDLVLTDVIMPDSDGLEAIRRIRAIDPKSRVVAMSGGSLLGNDYQLRAAKAAGAIAALSKPFEVDELVKLVETCLRKQPPGRAGVA